MSPEQVRGATVDPRSDVFSFGAMLFEMLSGVCAFRRETGVETLHAVLKEPAPRLVGLGLGPATADMQRLLDRCLAKDPAGALREGVRAGVRPQGRPLRLEGRASMPAASVAPAAGQPLRVLVVDDEEPARAILTEYLAREPDLEIVGQCRNGFEAVKAVAQLTPDLVFLDVQMPKLSGFEVLELIGRDVAVVFVTAFDEYAVRAFEVSAVDYLLKPVAPERVQAALVRARERLRTRTPMPVPEHRARRRSRPAPGWSGWWCARERTWS